MLPELEETFHEAAALARIWQDVQKRRRGVADLTAVFYSHNGMPKSKLEPGEKLLKADKIKAVYSKELPAYYRELRGQQRLWTRGHG